LTKYRWSEDEVNYVIENYGSLTIRELAKKLKRSFHEVRCLINNLQLHQKLRRKTIAECVKKRFLNLSAEEKAYLAGLIDGDGTISLNKEGRQYRPLLMVSTTDLRLANWLSKIFGVSYPRNNPHTPERVTWTHVPIYGYHILPILKELEKYLIVKKPQCVLVMKYIELRLKQKLRDRPTPEMIKIANDIKMLNLKGSKNLKAKLDKIEEFYEHYDKGR